eukprot:5364145-Prymnesium_polylepis.1
MTFRPPWDTGVVQDPEPSSRAPVLFSKKQATMACRRLAPFACETLPIPQREGATHKGGVLGCCLLYLKS